MPLDARGFGKPQRCKSCNATFTVAWGRDPGSGKAVPVVMAQRQAAPKAQSGPSTSSGVAGTPPPVQDTVNALCGCGNSKRVPAKQKNSPPRCAQCGKMMRIEDAPL